MCPIRIVYHVSWILRLAAMAIILVSFCEFFNIHPFCHKTFKDFFSAGFFKLFIELKGQKYALRAAVFFKPCHGQLLKET